MSNQMTVGIGSLAAVLLFASIASAQTGEITPGPGWKTCPRCQNDEQFKASLEQYKVKDHPFNPRDLSGIWGNFGTRLDMKNVPPMTDYGKKLWEATQSDVSPKGLTISNSKDGMLICDPLGYPRWLAYNYGMQFMMLPDQVLQFFELGHTWRTIWTDGRKLPPNPEEPRWLGYAIGRWEGDTFVIESSGFHEASWLDLDWRTRNRGMPHSGEMQLVERYRRTSYGTLDVELTISDPKVYTAPWKTTGTLELRPGAELGEYFCVPSESSQYNELLLKGTGAK